MSINWPKASKTNTSDEILNEMIDRKTMRSLARQNQRIDKIEEVFNQLLASIKQAALEAECELAVDMTSTGLSTQELASIEFELKSRDFRVVKVLDDWVIEW